MVKKPQSGMDEEEIIRRRDGVAGPASREPLDADAKRALADARLRALAFALGSEQGPFTGAEEADDSDLLAYLLDTLPEQRRSALEQALRGSPNAFGRLMTLRAAFSSPTDKRDRQRADNPARRISRHTAGRVDIRRRVEILQFRDANRPRASFDVGRLASVAVEHAALARPLPASRQMKRPRLEWGETTEGTLHNLLARARRDLDTETSLVNETQSSLERWWNIIRHEESETRERGALEDREAEELRERLTELLRELQIVASRIKEELGDVASAAAGMFPPPPLAALHSLDALFEEHRVVMAPPVALRSDHETWTSTFAVEAGPWALRLAGTAVPTPLLAVSLHGNQVGTPLAKPVLTLVRPAEGFETMHLDSSGSGKIVLPAGESVMLLQAEEVWEVHLSFRERQGA